MHTQRDAQHIISFVANLTDLFFERTMTKNKSKRVIRFILLFGSIASLYFVPWPIVKAWITPLPTTVQEQVNKANDYGFDGIIVYLDKKGEKHEFYTSGYKNREYKIPLDPL